MSTNIIVLKLVLLGDSAVGKTSLIDMYAHHQFKEDYKPTLGVNIVVKELKHKNTQIRLIIWDIAGQNKYDLSRKMFFQGVVGALFVYDTTRDETFKNIESKWLEDLFEYGDKNLAYVLIGNKNDLHDFRTVSIEEGSVLAEKINAIDFVETSAKYGDNVEKAFEKLVFQILKNERIEV
ncbi:MAG: GTP-binding protein [Promethearchaeota archaeon]|nr:MAG: GTP-binding protein [Candidatus Lokiarchaeota archaeon]